MNKLEQMLSENHGLHTSYSVKNKDGEFESVISVKSAAEITEQIAVEFVRWYENRDKSIDENMLTWEDYYKEFLKTKQ